MNDNKDPTEKPGFWQILGSTLAAALGVQSQRNRERDFSGGNIYVYLFAGLVFTLAFIVIVVVIVKTILHLNDV